jgi:hypothetical protein
VGASWESDESELRLGLWGVKHVVRLYCVSLFLIREFNRSKIMAKESITEFDRIVDEKHDIMSSEFDNDSHRIKSLIEQKRGIVCAFRNDGWGVHEKIWNPCLFMDIALYDLINLIRDFSFERDEWRRKAIARQLALLIYEIGEDIPAVFGRDFIRSVDAIKVPAEIFDDFVIRKKAIVVIWNIHKEQLKNIRLVAAAHRHHDAIILLDTIDEIDLWELHDVAVEMGKELDDLRINTEKILDFTKNVKPMIKK